MAVQRFTLPFFVCTAGILLFLSWYLPVDHGWWAVPDHEVFFFFNTAIAGNYSLAVFIAVINNRLFDLAALLLMGLVYYAAFRKQDSAGKRRLIMAGVVMVISAVLINQAGQAIPFHRLSPALALDSAHRVSEITGIFTKDASKSSFPGDHGLMLMIFAAFVWRYTGFRYFAAAVLLVVIFSLPRIMSGAHWFSDIMAGSLSLTLITVPWVLLTPLSDRYVNFLVRRMPRLSDITKKNSH